MRILLINKFWRQLGGVEKHAADCVETLTGRGHDVLPFATRSDEDWPSPIADKFPSAVSFRPESLSGYWRAASRALISAEPRRALKQVLDSEAIDVIHVLHVYHQLGVGTLKEIAQAGIPAILSLHDYKVGCPSYLLFNERTGTPCSLCVDHSLGFLWAPTATRCWNGSRAGGVLLTVEAATAKAARVYSGFRGAVVVPSQVLRNVVVSAGVPAEKVHIVRHYVEASPLARPALRGQHALFVGRLSKEKGVAFMLKAAARAGLPVRIVGDGLLRAELEEDSVRFGADATFLGNLPPTAVAAEMRAAGMLLVPSLSPETFGYVVAEAFAAGLPVIASKIGALTELAEEGRGILVDPGDLEGWEEAIRQLRERPNEAAERAANAHNFARLELSKSRWIHGMQEVYQSAGASQAL